MNSSSLTPPSGSPLPSSSRDLLRGAFESAESGRPSPGPVKTRLRYVGELMADAGLLPREPLLAWRNADRSVQHVLVGAEVVIARENGPGPLFPSDRRLSQPHFRVVRTPEGLFLEDLASRNGTFVNESDNPVSRAEVRDGDLVYAGQQIFAVLWATAR